MATLFMLMEEVASAQHKGSHNTHIYTHTCIHAYIQKVSQAWQHRSCIWRSIHTHIHTNIHAYIQKVLQLWRHRSCIWKRWRPPSTRVLVEQWLRISRMEWRKRCVCMYICMYVCMYVCKAQRTAGQNQCRQDGAKNLKNAIVKS